MKAVVIVLALLAPGSAQLASAAAQHFGGEPAELLKEWMALNSACRGGHGDDPATMAACTDRDEADRRLLAAGWCYGRAGEYEYQKQWHRCAAASPKQPGTPE